MQNGANIVSTFYYNNRLQPCRISVKSSGTAPIDCASATIGDVLDFTYSFNAGTAMWTKDSIFLDSVGYVRNCKPAQR